MDKDLVIAIGHAFAAFATVSQGYGVLQAAEFARLLRLLSLAATETSELQGAYLAAWAAMIGDIDSR